MILDYNFKKLCDIWSQQLQVCLVAEFHEKTKMPKNGSKNELFGYFWARILKHCFHICNLHYQICLTEKFPKKNTKKSEFWTKNDLFWHFWARILKHYCLIWNQQPQICWIAKLHEKRKMPKYGIKNALLWYLRSATTNYGIFGLEF